MTTNDSFPVISLAEVRDRTDVNTNGAFSARINALGNALRDVFYVSPYASNGEAAFIAIPEDGTQILVCQPVGSSSWYYMGATFSPEPEQVEAELGPIVGANTMPVDRVDPNIYRARGVPMKIVLKSPNAAGLTISEEYNPDFINRKTELTSTVNKKITLSDSPAIDSIVLDSGNGSTIKITDNPQTDDLPARAIEIESVGPQKYLNIGSQTDVVVEKGGRELQLLNQANGVEWGDGAICGNVNVQSKWKDVNVFTQAESGRIFIQCLKTNGTEQVIQIETKGTNGDIIIKAGGDITLNAEGGNLNIHADEEIRMKTKKFSLDCASVDIRAEQGIDIDAIEGNINLAGGGANPSEVLLPSEQSTYGNKGITTY